MNRSLGVTVVAILSLIGSALALAMGLLVAVGMAMVLSSADARPEGPFPPMFFKAILLIAPFFYILPAVWGIVTGIGLLRLKNWARISIIVFSVLLTVFGVFGSLAAVVMPQVPAGTDGDPNPLAFVRIVTVAFTIVQLGVGIWWLVFFNRASVKAQFNAQRIMVAGGPQYQANDAGQIPPPPQISPATPAASATSTRPLSISIIGWYLLVVSLFLPLNLILHTPAAFFTLLLTGWQATAYSLMIAAALVYISTGLLRLDPIARLVGIGYCVFAVLNTGVFFLAPGAVDRVSRIMEFQQSMFPWMKAGNDAFPMPKFDITPFMVLGAVSAIAFQLVVLYFLLSTKRAFEKPGQRKTSGDLHRHL